MNGFLKATRRSPRFLVLLVVALAPNSAVIAADNLDEAQAIREIERMGGIVERDEKLSGRPVTAIAFGVRSDFQDMDVPLLKTFSKLTRLDLRRTRICGTRIRGSGLRSLRELKNLTEVDLTNTRLTDAGLGEIAELRNLTVLRLAGTQITDAGLNELGRMKNLRYLNLRHTKITDAQLEGLRESLPNSIIYPLNAVTAGKLDESEAIREIRLLGGFFERDDKSPGRPVIAVEFMKGSRFGDKDIPLLLPLRNLTALDLSNTEVCGAGPRNAGLSELKVLKKLTSLDLSTTWTTDAGIDGLKQLKHLEWICLRRTKITDAGLHGLRNALPKTIIYPASAVTAASKLTESRAIHEIERLKGSVFRDDKLPGRPVTAVDFRRGSGFEDADIPLLIPLKDLADLSFCNSQVCGIHIEGASLNELKRLKNLTKLDLGRTRVTDAGLKELRDLRNLTALGLTATKITDAGLRELRGLKNLKTLTLAGNWITDAGLSDLGKLENLTMLNLSGSQVTGIGLKELGNLKYLAELSLNETPLTDAGVSELGELTTLKSLFLRHTKITKVRIKELGNLTTLDLSRTNVTDAGLTDLKRLGKLSKLYLDGTRVTDAGLRELRGLKNLEWLLLFDTKITDAGTNELKEFLPDVRILR